MPIEFACQNCQRLLRVPAGSAGRKARCPNCQTIADVPGQGGHASTVPDLPTPAAVGSAMPPKNPFAEQETPETPFEAAFNPYASSHVADRAYPLTRATARGKLLGPAIGMIIGSLLSMALSGLVMLVGIMEITQEGADEDNVAAMIILGVVFVASLIIGVGGIRMLMLKNYLFVMIATVISFLPMNCVWPLTVPFGIWAMVMLLNAEVRDVFHHSASQPQSGGV